MNKEFLEFADKLVDKSACENISKSSVGIFADTAEKLLTQRI